MGTAAHADVQSPMLSKKSDGKLRLCILSDTLVMCWMTVQPYPLIGLMDDIICKSLRHLAGSVLGSLKRMIQVALRCGGYHRGNERSDSSSSLHEEK